MRSKGLWGHRAQHRIAQDEGPRGSDAGESAATLVDTASDAAAATTEYSDAAVADLLYMIEEEKLAGDIYEAFAELYDAPVFDRIAESEDRHFDALIAQADALGIDTDVFVFAEAGEFSDPDLQALYDTLYAEGSQSLTDALDVGVLIEQKDLVDIAEAADAVADTQLAAVYDNLLAGSENHLVAFEMMLA